MKSNARARRNFSTKPLVAAIALALIAPAAFADNGMPGGGLVVRNQPNIEVNGIPLPGNNQIIGLMNNATIHDKLGGVGTVIQWGSPGVVDTANTPGFNVAFGKTINFTAAGAGSGFMNIDISGNLSSIAGTINVGPGIDFVIANEKGITVSTFATIVAPNGLSLVGANMNTIQAIDAYDGPANLQMNFAGSSPVTVQSGANLSGVGAFLLVAGSGVVSLTGSTGSLPVAGVPVYVVGGVGSDFNTLGGGLTVNDTGPVSDTVRSTAATDVTIGLGGFLDPYDASKLMVLANGNLTNNGNLDFMGASPSNFLEWTQKFTNNGTLVESAALTDLDFDMNGVNVSWSANTGGAQAYAQGGFENNGIMGATDGSVLVSTNNGEIRNTGSMTAGNGYVYLYTPGGDIGNYGGTISATTYVIATTGAGNFLNNAAGSVSAGSYIDVDAGGGVFYNEGSMTAGTYIDVDAAGFAGPSDNWGTMTAGSYIELNTDGPFTNHLGASMTANSGTLTIEAATGDVVNDGSIWALGNIDIDATNGGFSNTSNNSITSWLGDILVYAGNGDANNSGTMTAWGHIYMEADAADNMTQYNVTNSGTLTSQNEYVSLESNFGSVTNTAAGVINAYTGVYFFANYSTGALPGHATNAGAINITGPDATVEFFNDGPGDITVGGTVMATAPGAYIGYFSASRSNGATGTTTINTPITVLTDSGNNGIWVGGEKIVVNAPMTILEETPGGGAGWMNFYGTNNIGGNWLAINANQTAGSFYTTTASGGITGNSFFDMDVMLNGNLTTTTGGEQRAEFYDVRHVTGPGVITANALVFDASGSVRNPVSNFYTQNGLQITTVGTNPVITINGRAPAPQTFNLGITGDATVTSGQTVIAQAPCYSGLCPFPSGGYIPQANANSSFLATATGDLTVGANNVSGAYFTGGAGGLSASNGFLFPGATVFVAGGALNVNAVVDNAILGTAAAFQGIFFQGATINAQFSIFTNGNSFVNYSVLPNGGMSLAPVFQAKAGTNFLGFPNLTTVLNPLGSYLNTYTLLANTAASGGDWMALVNFNPIVLNP